MDARSHARLRLSRRAAAGALAARRFPDFTGRAQLGFWPELFSLHGIAFQISLQLGIRGARSNCRTLLLWNRHRAANFDCRLAHRPRRWRRTARLAPVNAMPRLGIPPRVREFALASLAVLLLIAP